MHVRCVKRPHIHAQGHDRSPFPAAASRKVSLLGNDNLEVFAGNDHGLVARGVEATDQVDKSYDLWHDRATFHFLTDPSDRAAYAACMRETRYVPAGA